MLGIITATIQEYTALGKILPNAERVHAQAGMEFLVGELNGQKVVGVQAGIGKVSAAICAQVMIDRFSPDAIINVGVSGPGVVMKALEAVRGADFGTLCETIKKTAFKITRVGQLVAKEASRRLGIPFGIIDLSLAPTPAVGDSIAGIFEMMGLEHAGAPGTTAALALLNDSVKKGGIMASS